MKCDPMPMATSNSAESKRTPLDYALIFVFLGAFVWLRWWSGIWQNRWVGFALGVVFAVVYLAKNLGRTGDDLRVKRGYLFGSVLLCLAVGGVSMSTFLFGFFGDKNGDNGCAGPIMLALGVQQANMYRRMYQQGHPNLATKD